MSINKQTGGAASSDPGLRSGVGLRSKHYSSSCQRMSCRILHEYRFDAISLHAPVAPGKLTLLGSIKAFRPNVYLWRRENGGVPGRVRQSGPQRGWAEKEFVGRGLSSSRSNSARRRRRLVSAGPVVASVASISCSNRGTSRGVFPVLRISPSIISPLGVRAGASFSILSPAPGGPTASQGASPGRNPTRTTRQIMDQPPEQLHLGLAG